ncbi:NAD(P)H-dependent oxidoreductase [Corynebacterium pseudodiphtheriticum]|uniref:NADPH-dependent FMN reductase n=1 Tax=Corynebacterium pseudodiphtheriticum TaxID=37637 RepID=UPI0025500DF2|nr:NAD(P)H-dependent oxidoreductase [Corynebacterium pseudodiphtheriticum]MDK8478885.1 NAD(P)H-dependent oxidoreductase [Corynebacterium pseudodiphtheriticum]
MNIGVFIGSIRAGRAGEAIGHWVHEHAASRNDGHNYEIIDLQDHDLPFLAADTVPAMANGEYGDPKTQQWAKVIAQYDGFVFVTPEYNGTVPGPAEKRLWSAIFRGLFAKFSGFPCTPVDLRL